MPFQPWTVRGGHCALHKASYWSRHKDGRRGELDSCRSYGTAPTWRQQCIRRPRLVYAPRPRARGSVQSRDYVGESTGPSTRS
ncbi:hypothetical protein MRX96_035765 [Rhipicephalus microplus]